MASRADHSRSQSPRGPSTSKAPVRRRSPPPPAVQRDRLQNVRVMEQANSDPKILPTVASDSPVFRVVVFALHLGLSILESPQGRQSLIVTASETWTNWSTRDQRKLAVYPRLGELTETIDALSVMPPLVDEFFVNVRANAPNLIVSDRPEGDGETQRYNWFHSGSDEYDPKYAALVFITKSIVDDTVHQAEKGRADDFRRNLFLLGMTVAHELVHMFVGYLGGKDNQLTPRDVTASTESAKKRSGEAGRHWEYELLRASPVPYLVEGHPLGIRQAGEFHAVDYHFAPKKATKLDVEWMDKIVAFDFRFPAPTVGKTFSVRESKHTTMQNVRPRRKNPRILSDGARDMMEILNVINAKPSHNISASMLQDIRKMVRDPRKVRG